MKVTYFAESTNYVDMFEKLVGESKPVKVATINKDVYFYDPKESCIFGYKDGNKTVPIAEIAIKDADYLEQAMEMLKDHGAKIVY